MSDDLDRVAAFREAAERYAAVIDAADGKTAEPAFAELAFVLPALYRAAVQLPRVAATTAALPDSARLTHEQWTAILRRLETVFGVDDGYWTVVPFGEEKRDPLVGSLADDLADIYRDVRTGADLYEAGDLQDEIIWEWRFSFWSHWGWHAVDALRIVHARLAEMGGPP